MKGPNRQTIENSLRKKSKESLKGATIKNLNEFLTFQNLG